jgi:hypothetical protein
MNNEDSNMAANAICHAAQQAGYEIQCAAAQHGRPSAVFKPRLFIDGNEYCSLFGENIQDGVAGFGATPALAMQAFDENWHAPIKPALSKLPYGW